jgi:hypothetical protein
VKVEKARELIAELMAENSGNGATGTEG